MSGKERGKSEENKLQTGLKSKNNAQLKYEKLAPVLSIMTKRYLAYLG